MFRWMMVSSSAALPLSFSMIALAFSVSALPV